MSYAHKNRTSRIGTTHVAEVYVPDLPTSASGLFLRDDGTWQSAGGGATGLLGPTGSQGNTGSQGLTGLPFGSTGLPGPTGAQGYTGSQGNTGVQGNTGAQGYTGAQGFTGAQGYTGSQGNTGVQGNTGAQGYTGYSYGTTGQLMVFFSGYPDYLYTGTQMDVYVPFPIYISNWTMLGGDTGASMGIGLWKDTYANFPPTSADNMTMGGTGPYLSTEVKRQGTSSGWTGPVVSAGNIIRVSIASSNNYFKRVSLALGYYKT